MKILCLLLSHFPLMCEALRNTAIIGKPAVIARSASSQKLLLDYSPELDGLQPDMPLQPALARHSEAEIIQADEPYYRAAFNEILDRLEGVSPLVEGAEMGCAYVGLDGLQLIYPDDNAAIDAVSNVIPDGFTPQTGVAANKFLAYLAARHCPPGGRRVLANDAASFLNDLSCDSLPVSLKTRSRLHAFGINTLGQAAALPLGPLQAQFGPEGRRLWNLARGIDDTPLNPRALAEAIEENITLGSVTVSLEPILVALEELLVKIFTTDVLKGRGIRRLAVWTRGWDASHWERIIQFKEPAGDIKTVMSRVKRVLESFPQPGPVEQVGLKITGLGWPGGRQGSIFREVRSRDHLMRDIRQLEFRLGNPQIFQVKEVEPWSRIPERRYALMPTGR